MERSRTIRTVMNARMRRGHIKSPPFKKRSFNENSMGWEDAAASGSRSKARNLDLRTTLVEPERFSVDFDGEVVKLHLDALAGYFMK